MTLNEAASRIGARVVYRLFEGARSKQEGIITSSNASYVFVRYDGDTGSKATYASDLTFAEASDGV
jgi:hypothetical protein